MHSLFRRRPVPRWLQWTFTIYVSAMLGALTVLAIWVNQIDDTPALEADHMETNENGALFRITDVHGTAGEPIRWADLQTSLPIEPLLDRDGIVQDQEVFFVAAIEPDTMHLVRISHDGALLWSGAFTSEALEPERTLLDELLDPDGDPTPPATWPYAALAWAGHKS